MKRTRFLDLLPIIGLMWVFLAIRVHQIDVQMPYFIDELNHINRARIIYAFSDLHVSTTPGKFLLYYWLGLFDLPANVPGWAARTATVLLSAIGAAATYALAKHLFAQWAGLLAVLLLSVFPFLLFHERLVLSDPLTASIVTLVVWWSLQWMNHPTPRRSTILGVMICFMLLAKILAGPIIFMPIAAIVLLSKRRIVWNKPLLPQIKALWTFYRPAIMRVIWINVAVWGVILTFYVGRGLLDPENTKPIVDDYIFVAEDRTSQLEKNFIHLKQMLQTLWGVALSSLALGSAVLLVWKQPRTALYLLGGIFALWIPLSVIAARPNSRYLTLIAHLWIVVSVGGVYWVWQMSEKRRWLFTPIAVLVVWYLAFGANFAQTLITEPTALDLPEAELNGYFRNFTGFGIRDSLHYVAAQPPISDDTDAVVMIGMTRACDFLPYHIPADVEIQIECFGDETKFSDINRILERYGQMYAVWEQVEPANKIIDVRWLHARMQWLATFERPHDGIKVNVYRIYATPPRAGGVATSPDNWVYNQ